MIMPVFVFILWVLHCTKCALIREGIENLGSVKHRNVLPCLGFAECNNLPALVSEWMENGNLIEFLNTNNSVARLEMVRENVLSNN